MGLSLLLLAGCEDDDGAPPLDGDAGTGAGAQDAAVFDAAVDGAPSAVDTGAATDSGLAADAMPAVTCTPASRRCSGDVAEVCVAAGNAWNGLACAGGCENGSCKPLSLQNGWKVHQFDLTDDSIKTPASYSFEMDGLVAVQANNPMASVYYNDTALPEGVVVTGRFGVRTASDDDLIGFVFGWQDPQHFYLFDWKQALQNDATCGQARAGASLKVVNADAPVDKCADFWASDGTARVVPLVGTEQNPQGWKDNVDYDLRLVFRPGAIEIAIKEGDTTVVSLTSNDTTYRSGKFGFFNYSQAAVRYEFFSISPLE